MALKVHLAQQRGDLTYCGVPFGSGRAPRVAFIYGGAAMTNERGLGSSATPTLEQICLHCVFGWEEHTGLAAVTLVE